MNKDNEKDDDTDSDMFCLAYRQMCRGCHPHKAAFVVKPQMMMIVVIIVQVHSTLPLESSISCQKRKISKQWVENKTNTVFGIMLKLTSLPCKLSVDQLSANIGPAKHYKNIFWKYSNVFAKYIQSLVGCKTAFLLFNHPHRASFRN